MPSSIRRLTALDHGRLSRLLRRALAPGPSQDRWRTEFVGLLRAHRVAERDHVLPAVVAGVPALAQVARDLAQDDVELDRIADEVERAGGPELQDRVGRALDAHTRRWAVELMAPLEDAVPRLEVRRLGGAYEQERDARLADQGVVEAPPRRLDLSRAELYELARRAGIDGRSSMTRGQLIAALQERTR